MSQDKPVLTSSQIEEFRAVLVHGAPGPAALLSDEEYERRADALCDMAKSAISRPAPGWVSVEERLPEGEVLAYWGHRELGVAFYNPAKDEWSSGPSFVNVLISPTHWMPMPAAPPASAQTSTHIFGDGKPGGEVLTNTWTGSKDVYKYPLEITKRCAEAMGYTHISDHWGGLPMTKETGIWNPLHDDAQAMALVKKFGLTLDPAEDKPPFEDWRVCAPPQEGQDWDSNSHAESSDLNRAICECVARISTPDSDSR